MIGLIGLIMVFMTFQFLAYDQTFNVGLIWVADHVQLETAMGAVPVPWFAAEDSLASVVVVPVLIGLRSEEHTSELQSLMRRSYAVFCLKKKRNNTKQKTN